MTRAIRQSQVILLAAALVSLVVSLGLTLLLGRTLPPEGFGFVALVSAVLALSRDITDLGSASVAAGLIAPTPALEHSVLEDLLGLRLVLAGFASAACAAFAMSREDPAQQAVLGAAAVVILLLHFNAFTTVFQVRQAQKEAGLLSVAGQIVTLGGSLALAFAAAAAPFFGVLLVARDATVAVGLRALAVRRLGYAPRPRLRNLLGSQLLGQSAIYGMAALCYNVAVQGSPLLVSLVCPPAELGAFAAAFRPIAPLLSLPWLLATPLVPVLAALASHDPHAFAARAGVTVQIAIGIGAIIAIAGWDLAEPMLRLIYNGHFVSDSPEAAMSLRWLAVALGATCVVAGATVTLLATRRLNEILALAVACLLLAVAGALILLPRIGVMGVAVAIAVAMMIVGAASVLLAFRQGVRPAGGFRAVVLLLPALLLALVIRLSPADTLFHVGFGAMATLAALAAAWGLAAAGNRERTV